ncbi:melanin-concentrating hormone receptor 1 [Engraulis encrasicolus]|uniref:melanin-concentrating hormone receptor 1 n=1 Tax=Engraulis encrasicolus TaxID=184585 RepID=UPI002FD0C9C1
MSRSQLRLSHIPENSQSAPWKQSRQIARGGRSQQRQHYGNVILPSVFGTICFLGVVGNCIVIFTILMKKKKTRSRASWAKQTVPDIFILNLSLADLLFLLGMPFLIHQLLGNGSWCFGATMCTVINALDSNSQTVSTYILTAMTLDRYLATVHPFRFGHVRTPCVAVAVVAAVWVLSLLSITPVLMYSGLMRLPGGGGGGGVDRVGCALLLPNPASDIYWFTLYQFVFAFALPLLVICVVFFKILRHMASAVAPLPPRSLRLRTKKVTRMAVAICLAFFLCWAPHYVLQLLHLGVQQPSAAFALAYNMAISLGYANSCINPFLYIVLSDTFKRHFMVAIQPQSAAAAAAAAAASHHKGAHPISSTTTDGEVSLRLAPDGQGQGGPQGSRKLPQQQGGRQENVGHK